MHVTIVRAVFFSPTGTTRKIVTTIADSVAEQLAVECKQLDFTLPEARESAPIFAADELAVVGTPVYAGRVPNILLKYLATLQGNGALAIPVVLFGNRNYDDALIELRDILQKDGFRTVAAAAFVGEHAFSYTLAAGRPDAADIAAATGFAQRVGAKLRDAGGRAPAPIDVNGVPYPYRGYFQPRDASGNAIDMRKVKPRVNDDCTDCKLCVAACPMGSISYGDVREYTGICIKCGACIKVCPEHARYYDDSQYLYHKQDLEESLTRRAEPELFV